MLNVNRCIQISLLLLAYSASSPAQDARSASTDTIERQSRQVIGALTENGIRFSSLGALMRIRLEVIGESGEAIFDSGFRSGNVVDWAATDVKGQRLEDGTYLCVVTVRDSAGRETRAHAMSIVRDKSAILKKTDTAQLDVAQREVASGISIGEEEVTIVESDGDLATAVVAHDGTMGNLVTGRGGLSISSGDFFGNKVRQQIRLTAEGNLGVGVASPLVRLDVDGMIRSSGGIVFPDGSVQFSAARKTYGAESQKPGQFPSNQSGGKGQFSAQASGTGTQNRIAKWTDNAGALGDSVITELNGNIGVGTTNPQAGLEYRGTTASFFTRDIGTANLGTAQSVLQLGVSNTGSRNAGVGPSFIFFSENSAGAKSFLGRVSGVWENPAAGSESAGIFFQVRANGADTNALTERMRITAAGNVGIGTGTPGARLHMVGASSNSAAPIAILESSGNQIPLSFRNSGTEQARIRSDSSGNLVLATLNGASQNIHLRAGDDSTTDLFIQSSTGNVGIGTTTPATRLEVHDGDVRSTGTGGRFTALNPNNQSAIVQLDWFNDGTNDWPRIRYGGNGEGAVNGFLIQGPGDATKLALLNSGRVGIGTTNPGHQLDVRGSSSNGHVAAIINDEANDNADGLIIRLNSNNVHVQQTNNYITFEIFDVVDGNVSVGSIQGNGSGGIEIGGPGNDYAEWLPRLNSAEKLQPGEIVGLYGSRITKNTQGAMRVMVVSTGPIVAGNDPGEHVRDQYERVAFIGQAQVRVRGAVQTGDFIIASGLNDGTGIAVSPDCISSEQFEQVVGQAWESSSDIGVKSVQTTVGLIQRDPTVRRLIESTRRQSAQLSSLEARLAAVELKINHTDRRKPAASRKNGPLRHVGPIAK